jgi:enamine deaminase RidA (YjgF/YER057c/UK114 family)
MRAQVAQALDNLETVLAAGGMTLANLVRLNWYVTDVEAFFPVHDLILERYGQAGCRPASTLLGVERLAFPELMVEIEATAVA